MRFVNPISSFLKCHRSTLTGAKMNFWSRCSKKSLIINGELKSCNILSLERAPIHILVNLVFPVQTETLLVVLQSFSGKNIFSKDRVCITRNITCSVLLILHVLQDVFCKIRVSCNFFQVRNWRCPSKVVGAKYKVSQCAPELLPYTLTLSERCVREAIWQKRRWQRCFYVRIE